MHRLLSTPCISEGMAPFHITGGTFHGILLKAREIREVTWDRVNPQFQLGRRAEGMSALAGAHLHTRAVFS